MERWAKLSKKCTSTPGQLYTGMSRRIFKINFDIFSIQGLEQKIENLIHVV